MIEFEVTDNIFFEALARAEELGKLKRSIRKGEGNIVGFIGEIAVQNFLRGAKKSNTFDYDLLLKNGQTVDVKSKMRAVKPKDYYDCSIADYYLQKCDWYVFCSILNDKKNPEFYPKGWILGFKSKDGIISEGSRVKKGDFDSDNNFTAHTDGYSIPISKLDTDYERLTT